MIRRFCCSMFIAAAMPLLCWGDDGKSLSGRSLVQTLQSQESDQPMTPTDVSAIERHKAGLMRKVQGEMPSGFEGDQFEFVQLKFNGYWKPDYPDANRHAAYRLSELTTLKVRVDGADDGSSLVVEAAPSNGSESKLSHYPFIYLSSPSDSRGKFKPTDDEMAALRRYLTNGGFIMVEETWGDQNRDYFMNLMKIILPEAHVTELGLAHSIFHFPYDMTPISQVLTKAIGANHTKLPQMGSDDSVDADYQYTYERRSPSDLSSLPQEQLMMPHYYAFADSAGRIMMLWCHNNDLADGWENENASMVFEQYSVKIAYPMLINIIMYAMLH